MTVVEYCRCGRKMERKGASDEMTAERLRAEFWVAHQGPHCGKIGRRVYDQVISEMLARKYGKEKQGPGVRGPRKKEPMLPGCE